MTLLHQLLDATAARFPARPALRHRDRSLVYQEVRERSLAVAGALRAAGIGRGDRVVVYLQNRPEVIEVALACSRLGAMFVPVNSMLKSRQLGYILRDSGARIIVSSTSALSTAAGQLAASPALQLQVVCDSPATGRQLSARSVAYEDFLAGAGPVSAEAACIDRDPAAILYTSGSTGPPKGVVVSHRNLVAGAQSVAAYLGNVADDRLLAALPLSFDYGFSQVSTAFYVGACAVLTHFSMAATLIQEINAEAITGLAGVPTMWAHLAAGEWPSGAGSSLRYVTNSGGAVAPAILRKLQERLPQARIYSMYGLTEAFRSTFLDPAQLARRPGSIGKAIPTQEVLVLRPDGSRCAPGETGELVHRGSLVTLGYWNDPERTRHRFRPLTPLNPGLIDETAVWSGDMVRADEEGYLYFLGRNDQLIKSSGHRVSPTEVEEIALEVSGTIEALAVGLPDDVLGHRIALAVVTEARCGDEIVEAVRQHCRMHMPSFMVPTHIHKVESIARNANGKQDRAATLSVLQDLVEAEGDGMSVQRSLR